MAEKSDPEDRLKNRERLKEAVQASQAASKALIKDAAALIHQAALLKTRAAEARAEAQEARALASYSIRPLLLTIPEAARQLQVAERVLRHILTEPDLESRLVERTRKVGIYYKFISLLPPGLMADLPPALPTGNRRNIEMGRKNKNGRRKRGEVIKPCRAQLQLLNAVRNRPLAKVSAAQVLGMLMVVSLCACTEACGYIAPPARRPLQADNASLACLLGLEIDRGGEVLCRSREILGSVVP